MRAALFGALIMLALLQLLGAAADMRQGWREFRAARTVTELKQASTELLLAAREFAFERGYATVRLATDGSSSSSVEAELARHRAGADRHLAVAIQLLSRDTLPADARAMAGRLEDVATKVQAARHLVDGEVTKPLAGRDGTVRERWVDASNTLVADVIDTLIALNQPAMAQGGSAVMLEQFIATALRLRDEAGRDALDVNRLLRSTTGLPPEALRPAVQKRARINLFWEELGQIAAQLPAGSVNAAIDLVRSAYIDEYLGDRERLLVGIMAGGPAPTREEMARLAASGVRGLNALTDLVAEAVALANGDAERRRDEALRALFMSAAGVVLALFATGLALTIVHFWVLKPIGALTRTMRSLAAGDLDVAVPTTRAGGEVGEMAQALEVFKGNARQLQVDNRERQRAERLLRIEREILEQAAGDAALPDLLAAVCSGVQQQLEAGVCGIVLLDSTGSAFGEVIGVDVPAAIKTATTDARLGPASSVSGSAVYRKEPMTVADISADERCALFREAAAQAGIRSCWALPILTADGESLGAFSVYRSMPGEPQSRELDLVGRACHLAAIAIVSRRAKDQLEQAKAAAELGSRTKSEFLANMSHELRTPLNAIIGFAEVLDGELREQGNPIANAGYASDIIASGRHLLQLINDILDVSKMEAGKLELRERICDVAELLAGCERIVRARALERRLDLQLEVPVGLPPVLVDDVKFKQIVLNLLTNAIKFTAPSGSVRVQAEASPGRGLVVAVTDTGIGIKAEDLAKVFVPFHQVDNIYARINPGTGLGLSLSKGLAELHGGRLTIDSVFGEGTTVTLTLPPSRLLSTDLADVRAIAF